MLIKDSLSATVEFRLIEGKNPQQVKIAEKSIVTLGSYKII